MLINRGMRVKTRYSINFFLGTLFFICMFSLCFYLVKKIFPLAPVTYSLSTVIELEETMNQELVPAQYNKVAASHKKIDLGLSYYRDANYRNYVQWFYSHITGDDAIASIILENADKNNISVSLAFALAYTESRYRARATNQNTNLSIDRGLFQLNDRSFPHLVEEDFFDPKISAQYGLAYLRKCLDTAGNEVAALAMYNAGTTKVRNGGTPQRTLNYIAHISSYREGLDALFVAEVIKKLQEQNGESQVVTMPTAVATNYPQFITFKK
ncbi:MAG: transglycosylase SLT domain-containing protein [Treponemataceae bacterium]